jgi:cell wall-associated NlpC family hydrolase
MLRHAVLIRALLALAASALTGACASGGGIPRPFPMPQSGPVQAVPEAGPQGSVPQTPIPQTPVPQAPVLDDYALVGTALSLRGVPYRNGGDNPEGFDCSGFTKYVYARHGITLPREVRDQFQQGKPVKPEELEAGDLLFFTTVAPGPTHVAIAIGGDQFVHAPSSAGVVRVERLSVRYWSARYLGARRIP